MCFSKAFLGIDPIYGLNLMRAPGRHFFTGYGLEPKTEYIKMFTYTHKSVDARQDPEGSDLNK